MERDTDEWRRPWTDEDPAGAVPTRRVRVVRPRPSTLDRDQDGREPLRPVARAQPEDDAGGPEGAPGGAGSRGTMPGTTPVVIDSRHREDPPADAPPATGRGLVAVALVAALVGGVVGAASALLVDDRLGRAEVPSGRAAEEDAVRAPVVGTVDVADGDTIVTAVASAVLPSVVRIDVLAEREDPDLGAVDVKVGVGSGVVYRSDGYLLTNNHVVEDADTLTVQFSDGTRVVAEIVGTDALTDLAVLRVDRDGLAAVNLRQDQPLEVGETAVAIGSPFGLDASVTAGVVSALNRDLEVPNDEGPGTLVIPALIQTDAAINPGNSGGALVDANGLLIGINTAILTGSGGSQGVGFAIPTRSVVAAAEQLIERGFVSHPFLGISGLDVTTEVAARYRDEFGIELDGGALVDQVVPDSGAAAGGVAPGDVIIELGGDSIGSMIDVIAGVLRFDPGDRVTVVVLRDGDRLELEVELGERPR